MYVCIIESKHKKYDQKEINSKKYKHQKYKHYGTFS